jgi:hypothetical protein
LFVFPVTKILFTDIFLGVIDNAIYQKVSNNYLSKIYVHTEEECNKIGGKWEIVGAFARNEACQFYSKDAGKSCFSGYQCELGNCEIPIHSKPFALCKCSSIRIRFGCRGEVHFGITSGGLCVD